jgi:hypothetical protein
MKRTSAFIFTLFLGLYAIQIPVQAQSNHAIRSVATKFFSIVFYDHDSATAVSMIDDAAVLLGSGSNFKELIQNMPSGEEMDQFQMGKIYVFDKKDMDTVAKEAKASFPNVGLWERLKEQLKTDQEVACVVEVIVPSGGTELFAVIVGKKGEAIKVLAADSAMQE